MKKPSTLAAMMLLSIFFNGFHVNAQITKVVTKCRTEGWSIDKNSQSQITFAKPPVLKTEIGGTGLKFSPTSTSPVKIRLSTYNNTLLKDITELKYSTSTESNSKRTAFLALQVEFTTSNLAANSKEKETVILVLNRCFRMGHTGVINSL